MISQQIRSSASLIDSIDAIRNWRAALLLLATLVVAAVVFTVGGLLSRFSFAFLALFGLVAYVVAFYGANAAGMMVMDEARGQKSRPVMAAVAHSLATSHRLILVLLLLGVVYLAGFLVLAIVLFICKIPFIGPVLYTVVFPLSVVIAGIAMFALPTVVFPLSAPSIWSGATTMQCVSQLLAIARKRLVMVLLLMVAVAFIAGVVAFLIGAILFTGTAVTTVLSVPILGGGMGMGGMDGMMGGDFAGLAMGMGSAGGHVIAAAIGGGILFAISFTLPGLVYLRGACTVYLRAVDGLDLAAEQAAIDAKIAEARAKARAMQAQAVAAAQPAPTPAPMYTPAPPAPTFAPPAPSFAPPAPTFSPPAPTFAPPAPVIAAPAPIFAPPLAAPAAPLAPGACPVCLAAVSPADMFCGECGHKLR